MTSMKCVSCGIGFFSPTGSNKCPKCTKNQGTEMDHGHDSCGCGHSH